MDTELSGKTVMVTGASSGIGRAAAVALGREGARVAITYRSNRAGAEQTAEQVAAAGGQAMTAPLDLGDPESIEAAVERFTSEWEGVDALVANAVEWPTARSANGRAEGLALAEWQRALRTNLDGTLATALAVLPSMRSRGWGRIVFISSGVAEEGVPGPNPYGVGKAALAGLTRQLAWDGGDDGILINAVAAGFTVTERNLEYFDDWVRDHAAARTPSGRLSRAEDVASLIVFLASGANRNLSGEVIREGSSTGRGGERLDPF